MDPFTTNKNSTTIFLLPILFPHITYNELIANYFEEAYIGILDEEEYDDTIILKFDYNSFTEDLREDVIEILNSSTLLDKSISENVICVEIPESKSKDYEHFLHGRWSKLSDEAKAAVLEFWAEDEESILTAIFNKKAKDVGAISLLKNYAVGDLLGSFDATIGEVWPPPNVQVDEMLFEIF